MYQMGRLILLAATHARDQDHALVFAAVQTLNVSLGPPGFLGIGYRCHHPTLSDSGIFGPGHPFIVPLRDRATDPAARYDKTVGLWSGTCSSPGPGTPGTGTGSSS